MSMYLEPTIEAFYKSLLKYAGLTENEQGDIVNINESFGDFSIDGVYFRLPYREYLKNPEGRNFFHLLNESYTMPETALFSLFKRRLVCEINIKLYTLMIKLIHVAANPTLQQRIKSTETLNMIAQIGEVDLTLEDSLATLFKASRKANGDGFLFDIHLKKNGSINDTPYAAIGKVNFHAFKEVRRSLETKDSGYKVFGSKIGKKQLLSIESLFLTVFPDITSPESFYIGTDFKGFRYLNALLLTSYQISSRINELTENLMEVKEPLLELEDGLCELGWASKLETLYGMMDQIRMIPNQNNPKLDARHRLAVKEPEVQPQSAPTQQPAYQPQAPAQQAPAQQPAYQPQPVQQPVQPVVQQPQAPAQQEPLTPEEIVRRSLQPQVYPAPGYGAPGGYPPPGYPYPQPMYPQPHPTHYPQPQPAFYPPQQPVYQQPMHPGYPQPQPVYQQPQPGYPQQPGMPVGHRPLDPFLSGGR